MVVVAGDGGRGVEPCGEGLVKGWHAYFTPKEGETRVACANTVRNESAKIPLNSQRSGDMGGGIGKLIHNNENIGETDGRTNNADTGALHQKGRVYLEYAVQVVQPELADEL